MDNTNRLTWWRLCLLVASASLNAFLLLVAGWLLVTFIGAEYRSHVYVKTIVANLPVGLALVSLADEALQGRTKRDILEKIDSIYHAHPNLSAYKKSFGDNGSGKVQGRDCVYYGGEFLVFRDEKFASFDADFKCHPDRYRYEFRGQNWETAK